MTNNNIPIMRTINEAVLEIKKEDGNTAVTKNFVRNLVINKKIPSVKAGRKYLINIDVLKNFLYNGEILETKEIKFGTIRQVSENILTPYMKRGAE